VAEWSIPPGPSDEELCELQDEEAEQLHFMLEPILKEIKEHKKRLRELRQKRLEAVSEKQRKKGGIATSDAPLPAGFESVLAQASSPQPVIEQNVVEKFTGPLPWEDKKLAADKAFKDKDWNTALSCYGQALDLGGEALTAQQRATLLSNRSLVHARLFEWQQSLDDAHEATHQEPGWPKGWLRRVTAELRLNRNREALNSLKQGFGCAGKIAGQFLPLTVECEAALYNDGNTQGPPEAPDSAVARISQFKEQALSHFKQGNFGLAVLSNTRALYHRSMMEKQEEAVTLSNRAAAFLSLGLANEALADALASSEKDVNWSKPLVRAGQAALLMDDFKAAYQHFAKARRLDEHYEAANDGVNSCLQKIIRWDYSAATRRWSRFTQDRGRSRENLRIWALSDVFFDQHGVPEWCKSLSSSFFRDDVLMLAGNLADSLPQLKFALTVLKSKFRRVFYVPGNHDLWVRRVTLSSLIKGEQVKDEHRSMGDSMSKLLEVLQVCDELGVETTAAEVAAGVYVVPMFSWYSRDFISKAMRVQHASATDADAKITIDQWIQWPFQCGADDAWKFFMRMNEATLRATLMAKSGFEAFSNQKAKVLTMTHFLTRPDLPFDWTVPGIWDYIGCEGLDEQARTIGTEVHVYGRACSGRQLQVLDGVSYVHNYIGSTEKHRPGMAPYCVFNHGAVCPEQQPSQASGFNFQPKARPEEPQMGRRSMGG
jgi:tetratricopeptide (TPR) repeat protein